MKNTDKITNMLFYTGVILFFLGFNFSDNPPSGWYLQTMPDLNGKSISDIFFLDSLNGWASTGTNNGPGNINYILKTTNGGNNWLIIFADSCFFSSIYFTDNNTGFVSGGSGGGRAYFYKTTNGGNNWSRLWNTGASEFDDMSVQNKDTIWVVDHDALTGGVSRTTNGGQSWVQQLSAGNQNPDKIYMYNARIGFIVRNNLAANIRKTTNGGESWFSVVNGEGFNDIYFIDSLTGWKAWSTDSIKKTSNGGLNWFKQNLPPSQNLNGQSAILKFAVLNRDTMWGVGAVKYNTPSPPESRGLIYISTNGGNNWGYQFPDPNQINIYRYYYVCLVNKNNIWAYTLNKGIHTTTGGDTTFYTDVEKIGTEVPSGFVLHQNYPNPFNPKTTIEYEIKQTCEVKLYVYDIRGKEVAYLVNRKLSPGKYKTDFPGVLYSSGVYFYMLAIDGKPADTKKMILIK
jgi:photosystem II stability/assembly factor-like uncharacterized protein